MREGVIITEFVSDDHLVLGTRVWPLAGAGHGGKSQQHVQGYSLGA